MITHVAPANLEARPNSLKLSESACLKELVIAQGQALERKPSNAWARKIPALNRPKNAVTVSIIAKSFAPPHEHNATTPRTVKRIPGPGRRSGRSDALAQQFLAEPGACRGLCNAGARTRASLEHSRQAALRSCSRAETGGGCQAEEAGCCPIDRRYLDGRSAPSGAAVTLAICLSARGGRDGET
jgi:hypothetical protein